MHCLNMDSHFKPPFQQYITALGQIVPIWHFSYWVEMLPTPNLFATCTGQKCLTYASPCSKVQCVLASSPGSRWIVGRGVKRACYTPFAQVLIFSVIGRVCIIFYSQYPSWVCTKILKYPKMYWGTCWFNGYAGHVATHTTASDCLLGQLLAN